MAELVGMSLGLSQLKIIGYVFYTFQRKQIMHNFSSRCAVNHSQYKMKPEWDRYNYFKPNYNASSGQSEL